MKTSFLYMTASSRDEARRIGRLLVKKRLVACVNILKGMESFYWWQGKMEEGREAVLIAKTRKTLVSKVIKAVKAAHSYTCPCIVELPIISGNPDFLKWIGDETAPRR